MAEVTSELPPKLERRYVVAGGSGLVGGFIVLQRLARGNLPEGIRIIAQSRSVYDAYTNMRNGSWVSHIVQNFVHGANVSIAHLQHEAALARPWIESTRQAGRPFVVTDLNPPITYSDLYNASETLSAPISHYQGATRRYASLLACGRDLC
ncbi:hypothetical protein F4814DRAFT_445961 [Daldinia grandis]|nr:hypothetical protein F4814DRAFT_445961 [Daldinia grandis]